MRRLDEPPEIPEEERERIGRAVVRRVQWGGAVFLAVVALGAVPRILSRWWPRAGLFAAEAIWIVAPLIGISLLVVAAIRLRR